MLGLWTQAPQLRAKLGSSPVQQKGPQQAPPPDPSAEPTRSSPPPPPPPRPRVSTDWTPELGREKWRTRGGRDDGLGHAQTPLARSPPPNSAGSAPEAPVGSQPGTGRRSSGRPCRRGRPRAGGGRPGRRGLQRTENSTTRPADRSLKLCNINRDVLVTAVSKASPRQPSLKPLIVKAWAGRVWEEAPSPWALGAGAGRGRTCARRCCSRRRAAGPPRPRQTRTPTVRIAHADV